MNSKPKSGDFCDITGIGGLVNPKNAKDLNYDVIEKNMLEGESSDDEDEDTDEDEDVEIDHVSQFTDKLKKLEKELGVNFDDSDDGQNEDEDDADDDEDEGAPSQAVTGIPTGEASPFAIARAGGELEQMTNEQQRRDHINSVMGGIQSDTVYNIEKERENDYRADMEEKIDMLRDTLDEEGVKIDHIQKNLKGLSNEEVSEILRILKMKNYRNRSCTLAEEFILGGAEAIETIFDGKNVFFKKYRPDYTGYKDTVSVKLRRMRPDTATVVGNIMSDYNIGSGARIFLELLPSLITYPRTRRKQQGEDDLCDDTELKAAYNDLQELDEGRNV
jgi:hypothetical protein